ncbi:MAG TPA: type IV pilus secretin PilQ [Steroidobacteraceae bacterium]|jgi:type IV pilus assembly protein PilQ|nr:type IV pilus secretin PilQ [Steroidobacteraceae bacterium]
MKSLSPMCRILSAATWLAVLAAFATLPTRPAFADDGPALKSIDVQPLANERVQVTLHLSGPAPQPLSFTIDNPARIAIDLPNTTLALPSRRIDVQSGGLESVVAAEGKSRSRLVLSLDKMMPYDIERQGDDIRVTLGTTDATSGQRGQASSGAAANDDDSSAAAAAPAAAPSASPYAQTWELRSIDFRRGSDGSGRIIVHLSDPHIPVNLQQVGNQIVVDFTNAAAPANLVRRYDASDFGTPVTDFDVTNSSHGSRVAIDATGEYEQLAYQSDDEYVVELQPLKKGEAQAQKPKYTGERLTLNFQDISVRAVLQLLADASGQNIVVSDSVGGSVTLRLQNVPWDQALAIILQTKGLGDRKEGNVILVAPQAELAAREKADLAAQNSVQQLEPLRSEYLQINYAKASDIAALIKGQSNSLLSKRGNVAVDDRTNTLLLQDTPEDLEQINRLVARLDVPVRQVLIEARIVLVNDDFSRQLGARLGMTDVQSNGNNGLVTTTGTAQGEDSIVSSALTSLQGNGGTSPFPVSIPTGTGGAPERYNVNLPIASPAGSIALGILSGTRLIDLELSAAEAETEAKDISSPRVITANQKQATIMQGVEIPYQQSASSGATSVAFKNAVLQLQVTPQITPDNRIILDLDVRDDEVGQVIVSSGGVNVPAIDTREITTQVLVNDGQTVVLGGILTTQQSDAQTKVPWLGDIPVLGNFFKTTARKNNKDELLIFVTPKIIRQGVNVY